jgi:ATP adenylyltransferase
MKKLWAPWRAPYIKRSIAEKNRKKKCIFCEARFRDKDHRVIFRTQHAVAMLNKYPYNNGHLMVAPSRHVKDLSSLTKDELLDVWQAVEKARALLARILKPQGFNIGMNIGSAAGAGIPGHVHIHIVPRWTGDTNFMPVLGKTKIISQSLDEVHKALKHAQRAD